MKLAELLLIRAKENLDKEVSQRIVAANTAAERKLRDNLRKIGIKKEGN